MDLFYFFIGVAIGIFWVIISKYKLVKETPDEKDDFDKREKETEEEMVDEDFHEELGDNTNYYYIQFPHLQRPVEISIEEPLELQHSITYRGLVYRITNVIHKTDGHSIYVATIIPKSNDNQEK